MRTYQLGRRGGRERLPQTGRENANWADRSFLHDETAATGQVRVDLKAGHSKIRLDPVIPLKTSVSTETKDELN